MVWALPIGTMENAAKLGLHIYHERREYAIESSQAASSAAVEAVCVAIEAVCVAVEAVCAAVEVVCAAVEAICVQGVWSMHRHSVSSLSAF